MNPSIDCALNGREAVMEVTIEKKYDGMLLREFLRQELDLSRASITRLKKKQNGLLLNGLHVTVRAVLKTNDRLSLALEDTVEDENALLFPQDLPFQVLFEDRDILAVDKPAGMPTHPTRGHLTDTLANGVAFRFQNTGRPFVFRAINRLDRDTSGVVLIALNKAAAGKLALQMQCRKIVKTYTAVLEGCLAQDEDVVQSFIKRVSAGKMKRMNDDSGAASEYAQTRYQCVYKNQRISVVNAFPMTGRTHQLRVHFSGMGHPICGDTLYGASVCCGGAKIERQALHASRLEFIHPFTQKPISIESRLPDDIQNLIEVNR